MRHIHRAATAAALLVLNACETPETQDETAPSEAPFEGEETSQAADALSTPRDGIDCGFNNNRTCKSAGPLANSTFYRTKWDPCYGGEFAWTATVNFEQGYDFLCVDGTANAAGCSNGPKITGNTTFTGRAEGRVALEIRTDWSEQSAGITSLTAVCDEPLHMGLWAPSFGASSQQLHRGLNWTQLNDKIATLTGQGLRLSKVEVYYTDVSSGYAYFDALFDPGSGGWGFNAGLTYAQLQSLKTSNAANGLLISDIEAQQTANGVVYVAVFKAGSGVQQLYDGSASGFEAWAAPYLNDDYKVTTLEAYQAQNGTFYGTSRLTAVLTRAGASKYTGGEWDVVTDVEYPELAKLWKENKTNGRNLARVETRVIGGVRKFDAVFQKSALTSDFAPLTRWQQFSERIATNKAQSWKLIDIDRAKSGFLSYAPLAEEALIVNELPAVPPEWAARTEAFMHPAGQPVAGGYTLALSRDGELLGATSSGETGNNGQRITPTAHWDYFSISKTLTGLAGLKIAEQKHYDIRTTTILPLIQNRLDPAKIGQPTAGWDLWDITIWDALTHNSKLMAPGCNDPGSEKDIITAANIDVNATNGYSGANPCMLRLLVEEESGLTFEEYFRRYITTPVGIHDMDCLKDPEHTEVFDYGIPMGQAGAPGSAFPVINNQCSAGGIKGTAMALLQVMGGLRSSGVILTDPAPPPDPSSPEAWPWGPSAFRAADMTFYAAQEHDVWRSAMMGGLAAGATWIVQFPEDPMNNTLANLRKTSAWTHGVEVVLFGNFAGMGLAPIVDLMKDAPP